MEKQKRIKRVFSSAGQVIHLWANQSQSEARCKNVFFNEKTIYSYGYHYVLGRIVEFNGSQLFLINDSGYSVTTNKHISWAWSAVSNRPRLKVDGLSRHDYTSSDLKALVRAALLRQQDGLINSLFNHFNGRSFWRVETEKEFYEGKYSDGGRIREFNELCKTLGFEALALDINDSYLELRFEHEREMIAKKAADDARKNTPEYLAEKEREREKREARAIAKAAEDVSKWRSGGPLVESVRALRPMILRVRGAVVETSDGASVPLSHALLLLKKIENGTAKAGDRIGHFSLTSVYGSDDIRVRIGCHDIALSEAKAVLSNQKTLTVVE